jgi:threonyl-tRNA synthetase
LLTRFLAACHAFPCCQVLGDPERLVIEKRIESIVKEGQRFERVVVTRDEALAMFQENKFKVRSQASAAAAAAGRPGSCCRSCSWVWEASAVGS